MENHVRKRTLFRFLFIMLGAVITLGSLEIAARRTYTMPWPERMFRIQRSWRQFPYSRNTFGLRDKEPSPIKAPGTYRILVLGDSFTFGVGVPQDEDTWVRILQRRLNLTGYRERMELLNAGIRGSVTEDWLRMTQRIWDEFRPDAVLIVYFLTDGIPRQYALWHRIEAVDNANRRNWLYRVSYAFRFLKDQYESRRVPRQYLEGFIESYLGNEQQTMQWRESQATLLRIRDYARQRYADVGFVIFPVLTQLNNNYPLQAVCDSIQAFAEGNGMLTKNLLPAFIGREGPGPWVSPYDEHLNEKAHRIAAESLLPFVKRIVREHLVADDANNNRRSASPLNAF
jgi:hypothetical protein